MAYGHREELRQINILLEQIDEAIALENVVDESGSDFTPAMKE